VECLHRTGKTDVWVSQGQSSPSPQSPGALSTRQAQVR
jgi:hypothetical protein